MDGATHLTVDDSRGDRGGGAEFGYVDLTVRRPFTRLTEQPECRPQAICEIGNPDTRLECTIGEMDAALGLDAAGCVLPRVERFLPGLDDETAIFDSNVFR